MYTGPHIIQDGLIVSLDAASLRSYSGTGSNITNLSGTATATLEGTTSYSTSSLGTKPGGIGAIRITNDTNTQAGNSSHIKLSSVSNITTVSLWYYEHSNYSPRYLLDMRTGGSNGWIYTGSTGANWSTGTLYKNGGNSQSIAWSNINSINTWINITVIANTPATDDINLFSRYSNTEGMDVTFGYGLIYNRVITDAENKQNYNALKNRFGL